MSESQYRLGVPHVMAIRIGEGLEDAEVEAVHSFMERLGIVDWEGADTGLVVRPGPLAPFLHVTVGQWLVSPRPGVLVALSDDVFQALLEECT